MKDNLEGMREIINNIPSEKFDSHEFIRKFSWNYEPEYVGFLNNYVKDHFQNVNKQMGKFLSENKELLKIEDAGVVSSPNVFGNVTENELWHKVK